MRGLWTQVSSASFLYLPSSSSPFLHRSFKPSFRLTWEIVMASSLSHRLPNTFNSCLHCWLGEFFKAKLIFVSVPSVKDPPPGHSHLRLSARCFRRFRTRCDGAHGPGQRPVLPALWHGTTKPPAAPRCTVFSLTLFPLALLFPLPEMSSISLPAWPTNSSSIPFPQDQVKHLLFGKRFPECTFLHIDPATKM